MKSRSQQPVFITARFRTGSTMLWNLFRVSPSMRAFYEPCHPNLLQHIRYTKPEQSHVEIDDYWSEYLPYLEQLHQIHRPEFAFQNFYLESEDSDPELKHYIATLTQLDPERLAVLQFNRCDLRLPWLRTQFPEARIIYLQRNPRDVWYSMLRNHAPEERDVPLSCDPYELMLESLSLSDQFPFIVSDDVQCSYHRFYYLWRLSQLLGQRHADLFLDFNRDFAKGVSTGIDSILHLVPELSEHRTAMIQLVRTANAGRWKEHRPDSWFAAIENICEDVLDRLGLIENFGLSPLSVIVRDHRAAWQQFSIKRRGQAIQQFLHMYARLAASAIESAGQLEELRSSRVETIDTSPPETASPKPEHSDTLTTSSIAVSAQRAA